MGLRNWRRDSLCRGLRVAHGFRGNHREGPVALDNLGDGRDAAAAAGTRLSGAPYLSNGLCASENSGANLTIRDGVTVADEHGEGRGPGPLWSIRVKAIFNSKNFPGRRILQKQ